MLNLHHLCLRFYRNFGRIKAMIITYYGASCFKVQSGETVIVFNPPSKESNYKSPRFSADLVLISLNHKDYNGKEEISAKKESGPFIIDGKGEYEIGGVYIKGISAPNALNTIYVLSFENIFLCHLGAFKGNLNPELKEEIGKVDILFVPTNNGELLDATEAAQVATNIEPKIVLPMHYEPGQLKKILKEFGAEEVKPIDKLTIKKKDLAEEKTEVVILEPVV